MTWREHSWEFMIGVFSWIVAIGALALVVAIVAVDAAKSRRKKGRR